jgi:hypothetical protein
MQSNNLPVPTGLFSACLIKSAVRNHYLSSRYKLGDSCISRTNCVKDLGVFIESKLYCHSHVDYILSQSIKLLGQIRNITFSFSTLDNLLILYFSLVRPKLECASVVWNSITSTDAKKLERIQRKFVALCYNRFLSPRQ